MKRGVCVLALVVSMSHAPAPANAGDDPLTSVLKRGGYTVSLSLKVRKKKRHSLQRVMEGILGDDEPNAFATGFVVGDGLVMTAHHVVSGNLSAHKKNLLGFSRDDELEVVAYVNGCEATVLKAAPEADLALLGVCGTGKQGGGRAYQPAPGRDEMLLVVARPDGGKTVKRGIFSGTYTYGGQEFWAAEIEGRDGFSGSPVFNGRGEIVGVFSRYDSAQGVALITPAERAQKLIEDYTSSLQP